MKVSVLITTYNQEEFITQAINGALMQEVSFDYEIVIGEDASTDRTREIVLELKKRYPDRIRVLLHDRVGAERDRALGVGGKAGFVKCLQACRGQYVALLDGDDYWTDVHKLQKQVEFLESHPDFTICCHNVTVIYEDGSKEPANLLPSGYRQVSTLEDLLFVNCIPTLSAVFRRGLFGDFPEWFYTLRIGDWPLHIMNAQHGKIGYIDEVMGAYRVHEKGTWSSTNLIDQRCEQIKMLDYLNRYLGFKYRKQVRAAKGGVHHQIAEICYGQGDVALGRKHLARYFWYTGFQESRSLLSLLLRRRAPIIYRSLRTLRNLLARLQPLKP